MVGGKLQHCSHWKSVIWYFLEKGTLVPFVMKEGWKEMQFVFCCQFSKSFLSLAHNILALFSTEENKSCFCVLFFFSFSTFPPISQSVYVNILMFIPKDHDVPSTYCQVPRQLCIRRQCHALLPVESVPVAGERHVSPLVSATVPSKQSRLVVTQWARMWMRVFCSGFFNVVEIHAQVIC